MFSITNPGSGYNGPKGSYSFTCSHPRVLSDDRNSSQVDQFYYECKDPLQQALSSLYMFFFHAHVISRDAFGHAGLEHEVGLWVTQ